METVRSPDGTAIAYYRGGSGPPLVLVHGTSGAYTRWARVLPDLEQHLTVYAVERRGRGQSGDSPAYALEREFEDVATVVDATGEPANLLGHSFGGIVALEAALLTSNLRRLVLYEGIPIPGTPMFPEGLIDRLQARLDAGDRQGLLAEFYLEVVRVSPQQLDEVRALPDWPGRVAAAHTLPREMRALVHYQFDAQRFQDFQTPTLLLCGGDSPQFVKTATEAMDSILPNSQIAVLPGQGHIAHHAAPDLFVREVLSFLNRPG